MSGDRLAKIERACHARIADKNLAPQLRGEALDVLFLVEIAKAARGVMYAEFENADEVLVPKDDFDALRAALARLDSGKGK